VTPTVRVRVLLFARLADLAGVRQRTLDLPGSARVRDAWAELASTPGFEALFPFVRIARNGQLVSLDEALCDDDELALLPPVGGG
jgi:molybdopterin converting factor small subunit